MNDPARTQTSVAGTTRARRQLGSALRSVSFWLIMVFAVCATVARLDAYRVPAWTLACLWLIVAGALVLRWAQPRLARRL